MALPIKGQRRRTDRPKSLQAAARLLPESTRKPDDRLDNGGFGWQSRAWAVVKSLGIVHYAMDFIRDNVAQLDFQVARTFDDPEAEPEPVDRDSEAAIELERLGNGPYGGVSDMFAQLVVHNDVAGEGNLAARYEDNGKPVQAPNIDDDRYSQPANVEEVWEVLTPQTRSRRDRNDTMRAVQWVRIWRPDPERPDWPDSSLRSVLVECEQLLLIQQHITGVLRSSLHSGILTVPEELDPTPPAPPEEGDDQMSPLMRDMFAALSSPIANEEAAAAVMPYLLMGRGELLDMVKHIDLSRSFDDELLAIAHALKETIAGGMDLPAERLLGMSTGNHWSAWLIDESTYVQHLKPDVDLVISGVVKQWLRPAWRAAGIANADDLTVVADPHKLTMYSAAGMPGDLPIDELETRATTAGILVRAGYEADAVLDTVGLPPMPHVGHLPTTVSDQPINPDAVTDPVTAAASGATIGDTLAEIDSRTLNDLWDDAAVLVALAVADAADRLDDAMAVAGIDPESADLVDQLIANQIGPEVLVSDATFDGLAETAAGLFAAGLAEAHAAIGLEGDPDTGGDTSAGATLLAASLVEWLGNQWFGNSHASSDRLIQLARGNPGIVEPPAQLVLDAMTRAGGGQGATVGSTGLSNGATVEAWLAQAGLDTVGWQWNYGTFPRESFRPHRRLAGKTFDSWESDVLANSSNRWPHNEYWFPSDHPNCGCRAIRFVTAT